MKCVCGYEYKQEWELKMDEDDGSNNGDEEFTRINGKFTRACDGWGNYEQDVYLYACPECGTIQMKG